jgi:hypothetical protein
VVVVVVREGINFSDVLIGKAADGHGNKGLF